MQPPGLDTEENLSLEEKLRRERQRLPLLGGKLTVGPVKPRNNGGGRILVPLQGNIYVQDLDGEGKGILRKVFDQTSTGREGGVN